MTRCLHYWLAGWLGKWLIHICTILLVFRTCIRANAVVVGVGTYVEMCVFYVARFVRHRFWGLVVEAKHTHTVSDEVTYYEYETVPLSPLRCSIPVECMHCRACGRISVSLNVSI